MGQRLNIEIKKGEECLANAYYHWSGYTFSAIELTNQILGTFNSDELEYNNNKELAVKLLLSTGAGLVENEIDIAKEFMEVESKYTATNRNDGFIGITNESMEETRMWEEARVEIDIENKIVNFSTIFNIDIDELKEEYDFKDEDIANIKEPIEDVSVISFEEFGAFGYTLEEISNAADNIAVFKDKDGYYMLIE